jgi:hypothetical protein
MKVRAKKAGFYNGHRVREGDVFVIAGEHEFSKRGWMERMEDKVADVKPSKKAQAKSPPPAKEVVLEETSQSDLDVI